MIIAEERRRMLTHPVFTDIVLHDDDELARALDARIASRDTIHAWPLSCVQAVGLDGGTRLIYKSQLPPTVEPVFYQRATSTLLPGYRLLGRLGDCDTMAIDWIDAPLLSDAVSNEYELLARGRRIVAEIGEIAGDLPTYLDIASAEAWAAVTGQVLDRYAALISDGRFTTPFPEAERRIRKWAETAGVVAAITRAPRVVHGDLKADQVFLTADGYRVIDWQRPVVAPPEIDLVGLLVGQGVDPRRHVDPVVVSVFWFLRLHWAVEAQYELFPASPVPLFDRWARDAARDILA